MQEIQPTPDEWRRLYDAAAAIKRMAPWTWMLEIDVFGVRDPETSELGFVSVMGNVEEHFAVAVYQGTTALGQFWDLEDNPDYTGERLMQIAQLQASFEDRDMIQPPDREVMKELGLKFRGRNAWPRFRAYRPGLVPWQVNGAEARQLTTVLEQLADVAPRFREDPTLLEELEGPTLLVRELHVVDEEPEWHDTLLLLPPPEPYNIVITVEERLLAQAEALPQTRARVEVDLFMTFASVRRPEDRAAFSFVLLSVDARSGFIYGQDLMLVETTIEEMWGRVPQKFVQLILRSGFLPAEVRVPSQLMVQLLSPVGEALGFRVTESGRMLQLDEAKAGLLAFLSRDGF